ncbi:MAG: hypothetical protein NTZ49_01275 [Candidatus Parcubacteria bacterium]|nr:hypothetical protein [Candidatus Parcubacteria bacterium]
MFFKDKYPPLTVLQCGTKGARIMMNPENFLVESNGRLSVNPEFKAEFASIEEAVGYLCSVLVYFHEELFCGNNIYDGNAKHSRKTPHPKKDWEFCHNEISKGSLLTGVALDAIFQDFGGYQSFRKLPFVKTLFGLRGSRYISVKYSEMKEFSGKK